MKKRFLSLMMAMLLASVTLACAEGKLLYNSTNLGQFTDLNVKGATTTKSGLRGQIDVTSLANSTSGQPVVTMTQSSATDALIAFTGTTTLSSSGATVTCYSTTGSAKTGTIKILVNGAPKYVAFTNSPN